MTTSNNPSAGRTESNGQNSRPPFVSNSANWRATIVLVLLSFFLAAVCLRTLPVAQADPVQQQLPEPFKSGSERSEVVLRDILGVLKKIDGRLERIESAILKAAKEEAKEERR